MKPCFGKQKQMALLAANSLDLQQEQALQAHLDSCAGCRRYFEEISRVASELRAAEVATNARPSASFHRNLMGALAEAKREPTLETLSAQIRAFWNWRLVVPTTAATLAIVAAWLFTTPRNHVPAPAPLVARLVPAPVTKLIPEPTFSNYEMAAHQSFEKLDELLTEQGNRSPEPAPSYTAGSLPRATLAD
jgi:hypothetical protein